MSGRAGGGPISPFNELGRLLRTEQPLEVTLSRLAELVRQTLPGVDGVSITVVTEKQGPYTVVFSGRVAIDLDECQYETGHGPCLDAARTVETVVVDYTDSHSRYGSFSERARSAGVVSSVSIGLPLDHRMVGGLNIYASQELDEASQEQAAAFAGYAAAAANAAFPALGEHARVDRRVTRGLVHQPASGVPAGHRGPAK